MTTLANLISNLSIDEIKHVDAVLLDANLAYSAGNSKRARQIFKNARKNSAGKPKKIFSALQKAPEMGIALDTHFDYIDPTI